MAWISAGGSASTESTNSNAYGDRTPIISDKYNDAFNAYAGNLNPAGANPTQQGAIDYTKDSLASGKIDNAATDANGLMSWIGKRDTNLYDGTLMPIANGAAPQLSGTPQATASTSADVGTGADAAMAYAPLFSQALIDPSLKAYDYGTDRAFSALDARTAGAGAFGNTRSGLGYSDLGAQSSLGRGQLASNLLTSGLTTAIGAGQQDLGRSQNNNQFNSNLLTNNSQFNTNLLQDTAKTNLAATQTNTTQKLQAAQQAANVLKDQAGLSQQIMDNITTADGIDMAKAQSLFTAGSITQEQLNQITAAAQSFNGSAYTDNKSSTTNKVEVHGGIGK